MSEQIIRIYKITAKFCLVTAVLAGWLQKQKITSTPRGGAAEVGNAAAISGDDNTEEKL